MTDDLSASVAWNRARASCCDLIEVRGTLPETITSPKTGATIHTGKAGGTVPKKSAFACGSCGATHDILSAVKQTGKAGAFAAYAAQGYCPTCDHHGEAYGGRFFIPYDNSNRLDRAHEEWEGLKDGELKDFWPRSELPYGFMTHKLNGGIPNHGFTHWWMMFNHTQLILHASLLAAIEKGRKLGGDVAADAALGVWQKYAQHDCMFCFWDSQQDCLAPHFANNNYHPKQNPVQNNPFTKLGRGNWQSSVATFIEAVEWRQNPWDLVDADGFRHLGLKGKTYKQRIGDGLDVGGGECGISCGSATDTDEMPESTYDLVVTDPPFGGLLHYSELSDYYYVWLRQVLKERYPHKFGPEYTPKTLEAVSNRARQPDDPDGYYQRLLTASWCSAHRMLKPGGILVFTFHHSEDAPWVQVLESLFDAGFYLESTYPIRGDDTKGKGEFGAKTVEYDIIHVCRKRTVESTPVSWAKMRREVLRDVRRLQELLEAHSEDGLPEADLQVIRRGKALEYFSKHYGKVYVDEDKPISVLEALAGINQLLDEEIGEVKDPPPVTAEPFTRQFLRLFDGADRMKRDQLQKFLRGTGIAPSEFESRGWCAERAKVYHVTPVLEVAHAWIGKKRAKFTNDYEQAAFMVGACMESSGINARDTLNNQNFKPHPALGALLEWFATRNTQQPVRNAARMAQVLYKDWVAKHRDDMKQLELFFSEEEA